MAGPEAAGEERAPALHCCQGGPPPDGVAEGWKHFLAMRTSARQSFMGVLSESVTEPDEHALADSLSGFCESHGIEPEPAFTALKACQFLLHRSAALDLDGERFAEDLRSLSGDDLGGVRLVGSRYPPLKGRIREELLLQTLADHGNVLTDLDWRVDTLTSSDRAVGLNAPVVFLTLKMRDSEESRRVTVQLTSRSIQLLRQFCQRFSEG